MNGTSKPFAIGNVVLSCPIVLAPMAGVCDLPYRVIAQQFGAGLVCTEMVSDKGLLYGNKTTQKMLTIDRANIRCPCRFLVLNQKRWPKLQS